MGFGNGYFGLRDLQHDNYIQTKCGMTYNDKRCTNSWQMSFIV